MNELFIREIVKKPVAPGEGGYVLSLPAVRALDRLELRAPVTFFVGENGAGKSTLIEALAVLCGLNPEGGSRNFSFSTYSSHSGLHRWLGLVRGARRPRDSYFLRAESFYNVATQIEELDSIPGAGPPLRDAYGGSLHEQSHGESFLALVQNRFGPQGLYLLDEPEAALSPMRQMTLLCEIDRLAKCGCQFVICTHSPILMALPGADLLLLDAGGMRRVPYTETEHYQMTRRFLNAPERMLHWLLDGPDDEKSDESINIL